MRELSLKHEWVQQGSFVVDNTREVVIAEIVRRHKAGEDVFVKFPDEHYKRPGAIAKIRKIEGTPPIVPGEAHSGGASDYTFHLKWDGRKNTAKVGVHYDGGNISYLPDYNGETVWEMFDPKAASEENDEPILDRLGHEIEVGDVVTYINARYGEGATIDFGVVEKIEFKSQQSWSGSHVQTIIHITSIAVDEDSVSEVSKIKKPERSVMVMTDVDLFDKAFVAKLTVTQDKMGE